MGTEHAVEPGAAAPGTTVDTRQGTTRPTDDTGHGTTGATDDTGHGTTGATDDTGHGSTARSEAIEADATPGAARGRDVRRAVLAPAAVYLVGQALTLLIVGLIAHARDRSLHPLLYSWDGQHMIDIATNGYSRSTAAGVWESVAFFPGYPTLLSVVHTVSRLSYANAGIAISAASGVAMAIGLARLMRTVLPGDGDRAALVLVLLAGTAPMAIVLTMAYSEALFCALAVWALVLMTERQWLDAAVAVAVAGTVRQTAVALCVALAVGLVVASRRGEAAGRDWAALAVAPIGAICYLVWVDHYTGVRGGWFEAQENGWGSGFDFGHDTAIWVYHAVVDVPALLDIATAAALLAAIGLTGGLALLAGRRYPELVAYTAVVVAIDVLTAGVMNSKIRLLVPAVTLLIAVAHWVSLQPRRLQWATAGVLAVGGAYYSAYALVIYGFAI